MRNNDYNTRPPFSNNNYNIKKTPPQMINNDYNMERPFRNNNCNVKKHLL